MSIAAFKPLALVGALSLTALLSFSSSATIVEFTTSQGDFTVNLHDETTPKTVTHFLNYVNGDHYDNTIIHRLVSNFIVQGGGYSFDGDFPLTLIDTNDTVPNEPVYSNVEYTIAMAKPSSDPDGANSQWFINYTDNSANLDLQNEGFTVFGEVTEGMDTIEKMASLYLCSDIPMPNYTDELCGDDSFVPGVENFVTVYDVIITDSTIVTDANLSSVKNTLINEEEPSSDGGSGGSFSIIALFALSLLSFTRKTKTS